MAELTLCLSGHGAGWASGDVEVGENVGCEGCEWKLGVAHDENRCCGLLSTPPPLISFAVSLWSAALPLCCEDLGSCRLLLC